MHYDTHDMNQLPNIVLKVLKQYLITCPLEYRQMEKEVFMFERLIRQF